MHCCKHSRYTHMSHVVWDLVAQKLVVADIFRVACCSRAMRAFFADLHDLWIEVSKRLSLARRYGMLQIGAKMRAACSHRCCECGARTRRAQLTPSLRIAVVCAACEGDGYRALCDRKWIRAEAVRLGLRVTPTVARVVGSIPTLKTSAAGAFLYDKRDVRGVIAEMPTKRAFPT